MNEGMPTAELTFFTFTQFRMQAQGTVLLTFKALSPISLNTKQFLQTSGQATFGQVHLDIYHCYFTVFNKNESI